MKTSGCVLGGGEWVEWRLLAKQTTASKKQQQQLK